MTNLVWLSLDPKIPATGYWDQNLLNSLLQPACDVYDIGRIPDSLEEAIVIIPGAYMGKHIHQINFELAKLKRCKVIITSDEENKFPIDQLKHDSMKIYASYMTDKYTSDIHWLPIGYAPMKAPESVIKDLDWVFAGQMNHESRKNLVEELKKLPKKSGILAASEGFAQGLPRKEYYKTMARAKAAPAPAGNVSPDSFRLYEALELGAVPVPEAPAFWDKLFGDQPFEALESWEDLPKTIDRIASDIQYRNNCFAWWQREKLKIKNELLGHDNNPTVIIPASPIKSHPSTDIIDETINSIKRQLPNSRIVVTFDGVRPEQEDRLEDYHEFIYRFLLKYNNQNVYPLIFSEHCHQVGMAKEALEHIHSDNIVYVEQDTPFTNDHIDWSGCQDLIRKGEADLVRFHFESFIPQPHAHMMLRDLKPEFLEAGRASFLRTCQWSQRPHIASKAFYERILQTCFSPNAKSFIEDKMHGICHNAYVRYGFKGWHSYRLTIYHPEEGSIQRSYHTDGRAGENKWDDTQVF